MEFLLPFECVEMKFMMFIGRALRTIDAPSIMHKKVKWCKKVLNKAIEAVLIAP